MLHKDAINPEAVLIAYLEYYRISRLTNSERAGIPGSCRCISYIIRSVCNYFLLCCKTWRAPIPNISGAPLSFWGSARLRNSIPHPKVDFRGQPKCCPMSIRRNLLQDKIGIPARLGEVVPHLHSQNVLAKKKNATSTAARLCSSILL